MGTMSNLHAELSMTAPALCQMLNDGTLPEAAVTDLARLMARLEQAEIDFTINNGEVIHLGLGTYIFINGGVRAIATMRQWIYMYGLNGVEDMLSDGSMEVDPHSIPTADSLDLDMHRGVEVRYTFIPQRGRSLTNLDLNEVMEYLRPMGTVDTERINDLMPGDAYVICNGSGQICCYWISNTSRSITASIGARQPQTRAVWG